MDSLTDPSERMFRTLISPSPFVVPPPCYILSSQAPARAEYLRKEVYVMEELKSSHFKWSDASSLHWNDLSGSALTYGDLQKTTDEVYSLLKDSADQVPQDLSASADSLVETYGSFENVKTIGEFVTVLHGFVHSDAFNKLISSACRAAIEQTVKHIIDILFSL